MHNRKTVCLTLLVFLAFLNLGSFEVKGAEDSAIVVAKSFFPHEEPGTRDLAAYLLGGWHKGAWLPDKAVALLLRGGERYRFYSLAGELGRGIGDRPRPMAEGNEPCHDTLVVPFARSPRLKTDFVAVSAPFDALPRKPQLLHPEQQVYKEATAAILREKGIARPVVRLTQVIRVDLDGDGTEEVLVSATHYAQGLRSSASPGDYSLVFLRQLVKGRMVTRVIAGDFCPKGVKFGAPGEHKVGAVLDLNGDGIMEIILFGRYYEGDWVTAYRLEGDKVVEIFTTGCGV